MKVVGSGGYAKQWGCNLCGCGGDRCTCIGQPSRSWFCVKCLFPSAAPDKSCRKCGHGIVLNQETRERT